MANRAQTGPGWVLGVVMVKKPAAALVGIARTTRAKNGPSPFGPGAPSVADLAQSAITLRSRAVQQVVEEFPISAACGHAAYMNCSELAFDHAGLTGSSF